MKRMVPLLALFALAAGCSKSDDHHGAPAPAHETPAPPPAPAEAAADYVKVSASHATPKPSDPDVFFIKKFRVVHADFDPQHLEGGSADLELDLTSLDSNNADRDADVEGESYLDVARFATATIHVDHVTKTGDDTYAADATVNAHGVEQKLPVTFTVLSRAGDAMRIKGSATFPRFAFAIGAPEGQPDSVGADITIELQLTLAKT
jgi:polyisoprenoid-binding protein YceI